MVCEEGYKVLLWAIDIVRDEEISFVRWAYLGREAEVTRRSSAQADRDTELMAQR